MKSIRMFVAAIAMAGLCAASASTQPPTAPSPERDHFKKMVGTWDTTMKMTMDGKTQESKGTATYKMDIGGNWLSSTIEMDMGGMKFVGRGYDNYCPIKKKFVGVWLDSMSTNPMTMEGTFDKDKKTLTMTGASVGPDGKPINRRMTSEVKDDNTFLFSMFMEDAKEPNFTILYKRKK